MKSFFIKSKNNSIFIDLKYSKEINEYINVLKNNDTQELELHVLYKFDSFVDQFLIRFGYDIKNIKLLFKTIKRKIINIDKIELHKLNYSKITYINHYGNVSTYLIDI